MLVNYRDPSDRSVVGGSKKCYGGEVEKPQNRGASEQRKRCTSCGIEKSHEEFYSKGDRLDSVCKECKKERSRADYRFKFGPRDKERFAALANILLDFHLERQREVIAELDALIERASGDKRC